MGDEWADRTGDGVEIDEESLAWLRRQVGDVAVASHAEAGPGPEPDRSGGDPTTVERAVAGMVGAGASDLHLQVGVPPYLRRNGQLEPLGQRPVSEPELSAGLDTLLSETGRAQLRSAGQCEAMVDRGEAGRFRVSAFRHQRRLAVAVRAIPASVPRLEQLGLPPALVALASRPAGLVLITGPTGSGKSTTLAAMVDHVNRTRAAHIITIEDPIEYLHHNQRSLIAQRQVGRDATTFAAALTAALRQDPDVIMLGEIRDLESIQIALTAAETGHLVLATLHSSDATSTVHRVIDVFPGEQQAQVRVQLASVLEGIVSQQLIPTADGRGRHPATEILMATSGARSLIRESKTHQLPSVIDAGGADGMHRMTASLERLVERGLVSAEEAFARTAGADRRGSGTAW